eukprot:jgi/Chrzof1/12098/Cz06g21090.t1
MQTHTPSSVCGTLAMLQAAMQSCIDLGITPKELASIAIGILARWENMSDKGYAAPQIQPGHVVEAINRFMHMLDSKVKQARLQQLLCWLRAQKLIP